MSTSAQLQSAGSLDYTAPAAARVQARSASVPWYIWSGVFAITSASIGGAWDVSWHRSIGRDTFWTPAHMAIYACGVLAAIVCGYLIFATTFGNSAAAQSRLRQRPRLPRSARSLHRGLGRHRHAHLRPLRQLVARRLRPRRQDRQPAPHPAHPRHPRRRRRSALPHPRRHEPRSAAAEAADHPIAPATSHCSVSSSTSAASPSPARCSSSSSTPGTSVLHSGQRLHRHGHRSARRLRDARAGLALSLGRNHRPPPSTPSLPSPRSSSSRSSRPLPNSARSSFPSPTWSRRSSPS